MATPGAFQVERLLLGSGGGRGAVGRAPLDWWRGRRRAGRRGGAGGGGGGCGGGCGDAALTGGASEAGRTGALVRRVIVDDHVTAGAAVLADAWAVAARVHR